MPGATTSNVDTETGRPGTCPWVGLARPVQKGGRGFRLGDKSPVKFEAKAFEGGQRFDFGQSRSAVATARFSTQ